MDSSKIKKWVKQFTISERKKFATTVIKACESCKFSDTFNMCSTCPFGEIFDSIIETNQEEKKH